MRFLADYSYECVNMGHEGGGRSFLAAPPEWFSQKKLSAPRNCPECKQWIKSQTDEMITCECGTKVRIPARAKIGHFKRVGPYVPVKQCQLCSIGQIPTKGVNNWPKRDRQLRFDKEALSDSFEKLVSSHQIQPRVISQSIDRYRRSTTINSTSGQRETRELHLERHIPNSVNSWTNTDVANKLGLSRPKSPTLFAGSATTALDLLKNMEDYMNNVDPANVREYRSGSNVVRVTYIEGHHGVEVTILRPLNDGTHEVITTHDNVSIDTISNNLKSNWR